MTDYYILDGKTPVACKDSIAWVDWLGENNCYVDEDKLDNITVATIFLGSAHVSWSGHLPLLFETFVFGGALNEQRSYYSTWEEAERGHAEMVERVKEAEG